VNEIQNRDKPIRDILRSGVFFFIWQDLECGKSVIDVYVE
jgi:hypothetical protein